MKLALIEDALLYFAWPMHWQQLLAGGLLCKNPGHLIIAAIAKSRTDNLL